MKLLLAVSADGFIARGPNDNMSWLGPTDKGIFQLLTRQDTNNILVRSRKTAMAMPKILPGRRMIDVSTRGSSSTTFGTLADAHAAFPDAWMVGGQTLALAAIKAKFISSAFICQSSRYCFEGIQSVLEETLVSHGIRLATEITIGDVKVKRYSWS